MPKSDRDQHRLPPQLRKWTSLKHVGYGNGNHPEITIQRILSGIQPDYPAHRRDATSQKAPRSRPAPAENLTLPLLPDPD